MKTFDTMRDSLRYGLRELKAGATLHVMGDLDADLRDEFRALDCVAAAPGHRVVFHPLAQEIGPAGHAWCPDCGESTAEGGEA